MSTATAPKAHASIQTTVKRGHSVDSALLLGAVINQVCLVSSFAGCQDTEELL